MVATKAERDANLNKLKTAAADWVEKEIKRIENETKFLRSALLGRGVSGTAIENLDVASKLVQAEITSFLLTR